MPKVEYVLSALSKIEQTVVRVIDNSEAITSHHQVLSFRPTRYEGVGCSDCRFIGIKECPLGSYLGEAPNQL